MSSFGFSITNTRQVNLDTLPNKTYEEILRLEPSARRCIMCGTCAATCTASEINGFNFRYTHLLLQRGLMENLATELSKCMLCGKCQMVCPREVNTRSVILKTKALIAGSTPKHYSL